MPYSPTYDWIRNAVKPMVSKIVQIVGTPESTCAYHYTDAPGLLNIDKTCELWATDLRYVNDASELQTAGRVFIQVLQEYESKFPKDISAVIHQLKQSVMEERRPVYAISFSMNGDDLGQWRGYCPNGKGYSLGFDFVSLANHPKQDWLLLPCIYHSETQKELFVTLVMAAIKYAEEQIDLKRPNDEIAMDILYGLVAHVWYFAPGIKDIAFREEKEWRLVCMDNVSDRVRYRTRNGTLIPYVVFPLFQEDTVTYPITDLVIGPTHHKELGLAAAKGFAALSKLGIQQVRSSIIPYQV